jgi:hypothetical protein
MKTSLLKVAVLAALLSGLPCCFPETQNAEIAKTARDFVESLYARYGPNGNPVNLLAENAPEAFDPSLIALAKANAAAAGNGYVGVLDYDPLCNCQDTDVTFPNLRIIIRPVTTRRVAATVTFTEDNHERNTILLTLMRESGKWRIYDIEDFSGSSYHTNLRLLLKRDMPKPSGKQRS